LIGTASKDFGIAIKRAFPEVRRFKEVGLMHTDREVMVHGIELVQWGSMVGVVTHRQPIALYEAIDFDKPFRDMMMGMLPAKIGAIMVSIALALRPLSSVTIYDPFVGSGTIPMLALARGYHALGSDIAHITQCKRAMQWRVNRHPSCATLSWSIWHHDATDAKNKPLARFTTHVVTE
jgi:tRNA G10  N-methylase Trm11